MLRRLAFLYGLSTLPIASTQEVGVDLCACQPAFYNFTLNLTADCGDSTIDNSIPGVNDVACILNTLGNENVTDSVPVVVDAIQVLELDQDSQVISQRTIDRRLTTGDSFNYTSIVASNPAAINATTLPRGIQVFLTGANAAGQSIINFYAILYDNDCSIYPVLEPGQMIGWTQLTLTEAPHAKFCPAAAPPSPPMTEAPSDRPSDVPSSIPVTEAPSSLPTTMTTPPAIAPTVGPTAAPTVPPATASPTTTPVEEPTQVNTAAPTQAPVTRAPATRAPATPSPTKAPSTSSPTQGPQPTPLPTVECPPIPHTGIRAMKKRPKTAQTGMSKISKPIASSKKSKKKKSAKMSMHMSGSSSTKSSIYTDDDAPSGRRRQLMVGTPSPTACPEPLEVRHYLMGLH